MLTNVLDQLSQPFPPLKVGDELSCFGFLSFSIQVVKADLQISTQSAQFFTAFYKGFPDMGWATEDMVAEGDKVVVRCTWSGTQTGEWMGAAPTGKKYTQPCMVIYRIAAGKIAEAWTVNDAMKEVGAIASASPKK